MRAARSVLLAVLIVAASLVGSVGMIGPAEAQTDTFAQQFTTGPHKVAIDLSNVTTDVTISVITSESPAGDNATIMRKDVSGSTTSAHFRNAGAYQEFTVQVSGADTKPGFSKGGPTDAWLPTSPGVFLGDTGGDPGFTYDLTEQIGEATNPWIIQLDRTGLPSRSTVNTTGTDASQTKIDIYQSAQDSKAQAENYHTTLENYLQDTETVARIKGKNAYIKALNNGSSKAAAKTAAKQAVSDYYAVKQANLVSEWNTQIQNWYYLEGVADNESGIDSTPDGFLNVSESGTTDAWEVYSDRKTESRTLLNGSSVTAETPVIGYKESSGTFSNPNTFTLTTGDRSITRGSDSVSTTVHGLRVEAPNSNYQPVQVVDFSRYASLWSTIKSQNQQVQNEMDVLANNTYSAYQAGEINNSDLVDPYLLASEYSAGNSHQSFAAAQLTLLGQNSPENFDQIGSFNVSTSGSQYEGVLFSAESPASGQFENGTTYDAANISGTQYVVTSDRIVELSGTFTIDRITDQSGQTVQNVTIQKTQYQTSNVTELKQMYEDLAYRRAQIEAREQALAGGGGGVLSGSSSSVAIVAVAAAAVLLLKN